MDNQNVISLSNNIADLDKEMNSWLNLTFDERKRSDDACINQYGCTNTELYNRLKASLLKQETLPEDPVQIKMVMSEAFVNASDSEFSDLSQEILYNKIQTCLFLQKSDPNIVIICDFLSDNEPDYNYNGLVSKYNRYLSLPSNYKGFSNDYSMEFWGRSVPEMFTYMKGKIQSNEKDNSIYIKRSVVDKNLDRYRNEMEELSRNKNFLEFTLRKIDCLSKHEGLYESAILSSFVEQIKIDDKHNYRLDIPAIVPYFTYDEFCNITGETDITPFDYVMIDNQKDYYKIIHDLQLQLNNTNDKSIEEQIMLLGWNPYVKICGESMKYAREKQILWFNEKEQCRIIDIKNYSTDNINILKEDVFDENKILEPVFIVLSHSGTLFGKIINRFKKCKYSHAGICLNSKLSQIYSFGIRRNTHENGLIIESLDDYCDKDGNADLLVLALFVDPVVKGKIEKGLNWYIVNQDKTKYSIRNIARIVTNKAIDSTNSLEMVCSQFVDSILKMANINITDKSSNLVAPNDLEKAKDGINLFILFEGKKSDYNFVIIDKLVDFLKHRLDFNKLNVYHPTEIIGKLKEYKLENFDINCEDKTISHELSILRNYIKPQPSIVMKEMKFPIRFNKSGDLIVNLPQDLQKEYDESHKLLYMYDETNLVGIKHELSKLYYLNNIIEKKVKKIDKKDPEYKELMDLRARILNDFSTFFKIVKSVENDFDFSEYMKSSEYYNKDIVVDNTTLKHSGKLIKKFFSLKK